MKDVIDDQVNMGELAESKEQRYAADNASDDGMRELPGDAAVALYGLQKKTTPMQWVRHPKEWFGAGGRRRGL